MFPSLTLLVSASKDIVSQPFKRSQLGLFHGKLRRSGNNVPFSKNKTRRTWYPNIQNKSYFSHALGREIEVKVTTRAMKTIKKYGGLDQYVLNTKSDLLGHEGMRIRMLVRDKLQAAERP